MRNLLTAVLLVFTMSAPAWGQSPPDRKWTVELFGGYGLGTSSSGGSAAALPAGTPFTTEGNFPSRANPSWYFGDGAALFNEVAAQFGTRFGIQVPAITPLDAVLGSAGVKDDGGAGFGVRVTRRLTSRVALELGFQRLQSSIALDSGARAGLEATRASFEAGFNGLLSTIPQAGLQVTSTVEGGNDATLGRTLLSAAANITLARSDRFTLYGTLGVGKLANDDSDVEVRLRGNYQFRFFDVNPINESDSVTVRFAEGEGGVAGIFGAGFTYGLGARQGLRLDVRALAVERSATTTIDAVPAVARTGAPVGLPSRTTPSIQFSNTASLRSSLDGALTRQETFSSSGTQIRPQVTAGFFIRF